MRYGDQFTRFAHFADGIETTAIAAAPNATLTLLTLSACDMIADTLMCARLSIKDQLSKHFSVLILGLCDFLLAKVLCITVIKCLAS